MVSHFTAWDRVVGVIKFSSPLKAGSQYTLERASERSVICLRRVATRSAYKMIWTRVAYAGIEIISIPAYAHFATHVQIIFLYALPVATLAQAYIVNWP